MGPFLNTTRHTRIDIQGGYHLEIFMNFLWYVLTETSVALYYVGDRNIRRTIAFIILPPNTPGYFLTMHMFCPMQVFWVKVVARYDLTD